MALQSPLGRSPSATLRILTIALVVLGGVSAVLKARDGPGEALRLPPIQVFDEQGSPAAVVFDHESHVVYTEARCLACHPEPFSILGRHRPVRHEELDSGASCGICHNGRDATDVQDPEACEVCHTGRPEAAEEARP